MEEAVTATPIERDVVIVTGADAAAHLQTQLTQDVVGLPDNQPAWTFMLNPKAVIEAMMRVTRTRDGAILLDVEPGESGPIVTRLDRFLSNMDVSFAVEVWTGFAWRGPGANDTSVDAPIVAKYPWEMSAAVDIIGPDVPTPEGVSPLTGHGLETARIMANWPAMGSEIDGEVTPAMTGIVDQTVSFTKGCYTGQEFVARVHYRDAQPPKRLVQIAFAPDSPIGGGSSMTIDADVVGKVTSVVPEAGLGLGYCKRAVTSPAEVRIGSTAASVR